jgi:phosphate:Na+ symporter
MNWWLLSVLLLGGLSLFLHGMNVMTEGLKAAAGNRMKTFLKSMTRNRWTSLFAGTGITAIIQSSSVTTVLAVGFVSAGLITFQSTLGIILGANLGTTITAQIIAFKITKASWIMIAFGYLFSVIFAKKSFKEIGTIVLGLGLVFLGMNIMSEATGPLKTYEPFINAMKGLDNYLWGILIGTVFTAAVQSSSATTGVIIVLASQGLISVDAGIAIIFGSNIGTCVTAVLSALGKPKDAMRVAFSHVFFNVVGVLIWYAFIPQLSELTAFISEGQHARQIANAHTIFNLANTILFIWLVKPVSKFVMWVLPIKKTKKQELFPELHHYFTENTSLAVDLANEATVKMGQYTLKILERGLEIALVGNQSELVGLRKRDEKVDSGQAEILNFLRTIQQGTIEKAEVTRLEKLIEAVNILESAADLITTNLVEAAEHRIENDLKVSKITLDKLSVLYQLAFESFSSALNKLAEVNNEKVKMISKIYFKEEFQQVRSYLMQRLSESDENRIVIFRFESEILEVIRRLHALARRLERKAN